MFIHHVGVVRCLTTAAPSDVCRISRATTRTVCPLVSGCSGAPFAFERGGAGIWFACKRKMKFKVGIFLLTAFLAKALLLPEAAERASITYQNKPIRFMRRSIAIGGLKALSSQHWWRRCLWARVADVRWTRKAYLPRNAGSALTL